MGQVFYGSGKLALFEVTNKVKQGHGIASVLFTLFFACMLFLAVKDLEEECILDIMWMDLTLIFEV